MANIKIGDLVTLSDPISTDVLPIVDVSADTTNKISIEELLKNAANGTQSLPAFAFDADPNTGMYRSGADALAFSTGGTGRLFIDSSGNVGVGTSSPGYRLDVKSPGNGQFFINGQNSSGNNIFQIYESSTGDGQNGMLYLYDGAGNNDVKLSTNGASWFNGGNVGIGTATPYGPLSINNNGAPATSGNINNGLVVHNGTTGTAINIGTNDSGGYSWIKSAYVNNANIGIDLAFLVGATERMRIDTSGRLLVGTLSARSSGGHTGSFQLEGTTFATATAAITTNSNDGNGAYLNFGKARGGSIGSTTIVNSGDVLGQIQFNGSDGTSLQNAAFITAVVDGTPGTNDMPGLLMFSTTADGASLPTPRMTIKNDGNVGIGTSSPARALEVHGTTSTVISATSSTAYVYLGLFNSTSAGGFIGYESSDMNFWTGGTEKMRIDSSGNVGIGGTPTNDANTTTFEVITDATTARMILTSNAVGGGKYGWYTNNEGQLAAYDYTAASERMRIDSSGRLLVGTSTARSNFFNTASSAPQQFQVEGTTGNICSVASICSAADTSGGRLLLAHQRSGAVGGNTILNSGDQAGYITFQGNDGGEFVECASIEALIDGTPGSNDMPGRLVFSTTADGASSPTERFTLNRVGDAVFSNTSAVYPATDNAATIGGSSNRWSAVWAANGTIQTSDQRAKTDITSATLGTDFIKALRPVSYKWVEGGKRDTGERDEDGNYIYESVPGTRTHWGFIAQEVKEIVDAAGIDFGGWVLTDKDDPDSQQALRYDQFIAPLTKALQEAMERIETLEQRLTDAGL